MKLSLTVWDCRVLLNMFYNLSQFGYDYPRLWNGAVTIWQGLNDKMSGGHDKCEGGRILSSVLRILDLMEWRTSIP